MQEVVAFWLSIPAEHRGWIEFWALSALVGLARLGVRRFAPTANVPGWLQAIDWLAQAVTASSKALGDKAARTPHGGVNDWLLPRVELPNDSRRPNE